MRIVTFTRDVDGYTEGRSYRLSDIAAAKYAKAGAIEGSAKPKKVGGNKRAAGPSKDK